MEIIAKRIKFVFLKSMALVIAEPFLAFIISKAKKYGSKEELEYFIEMRDELRETMKDAHQYLWTDYKSL